jgi:hypothetical protein
MNTQYSSSVNYEKDYWNALKNDKEKCGYYTCLEYIDELDILLRTYQRSDTEPYDGLQIYKDGTLIGDVDIPKLMKIAGYIEPYIYGASVDEDNESIKIFRFKLDL